MSNIDREALLNALHAAMDGDYLIDGDGEAIGLSEAGAADVTRWAAEAVIELVEDAREQDMSNIDQALVDQMAQTITGALAGCDLRTTRAAVYGGNVAAGAVTPLIAAAVDAARAEAWGEGYQAGHIDGVLVGTALAEGDAARAEAARLRAAVTEAAPK